MPIRAKAASTLPAVVTNFTMQSAGTRRIPPPIICRMIGRVSFDCHGEQHGGHASMVPDVVLVDHERFSVYTSAYLVLPDCAVTPTMARSGVTVLSSVPKPLNCNPFRIAACPVQLA